MFLSEFLPSVGAYKEEVLPFANVKAKTEGKRGQAELKSFTGQRGKEYMEALGNTTVLNVQPYRNRSHYGMKKLH